MFKAGWFAHNPLENENISDIADNELLELEHDVVDRLESETYLF